MLAKIEKKTLFFVIMVYISFFSLFWVLAGDTIQWIIFAIIIIITLTFGCWIVISNIKILLHITSHMSEIRRTHLKTQWKFLKLSLIPFFILNFLYWTICVVIVPMGFVYALYLPGVVVLTYTVTAITGICGSSTIMAYERAGQLQKELTVIHLILQFVFVLDIFDTIYLLRKYGKSISTNC